MLRIGVTGHRLLTDEDAVADEAATALRRIAEEHAAPIAEVVVVSLLAAGADLVVTERALEMGAAAEVFLPAALTDYVDTIPPDQRARFEAALGRSLVVAPAAAADAPECYRSAGRCMLESVDVLLAVWDGEPARGPGGTGDVVTLARDIGVPVVRIAAVGAIYGA